MEWKITLFLGEDFNVELISNTPLQNVHKLLSTSVGYFTFCIAILKLLNVTLNSTQNVYNGCKLYYCILLGFTLTYKTGQFGTICTDGIVEVELQKALLVVKEGTIFRCSTRRTFRIMTNVSFSSVFPIPSSLQPNHVRIKKQKFRPLSRRQF